MSATTIHRRLRELRTAAMQSQPFVGRAIGVKGVTISRWENGVSEPSLGDVAALACHFGVPIETLTGEVLPPDMRAGDAELLAAARRLTTDERLELLRYARFIEQGRKP